MIPIHFAPLQGHTDDVYRRSHHQLIGGVECYYTPFVRVEAGDIRSKDRRDIDPKNNEGVPVVPQIIFKNLKEFAYLFYDVGVSKNARAASMLGLQGKGATHVEVYRTISQGLYLID